MQELLIAVARGLVEDKDAVQVTVDHGKYPPKFCFYGPVVFPRGLAIYISPWGQRGLRVISNS